MGWKRAISETAATVGPSKRAESGLTRFFDDEGDEAAADDEDGGGDAKDDDDANGDGDADVSDADEAVAFGCKFVVGGFVRAEAERERNGSGATLSGCPAPKKCDKGYIATCHEIEMG